MEGVAPETTPAPPGIPGVLRAFAIDHATVTPLGGGLSGAVWKVEDASHRYVLRRHALPGVTVAEIVSELAWLEALSEHATVRVPVPVRRADGELAPVAGNAPDGTAGEAWTLAHWVDGTTLGRLPDAGEATRIGSMLADLHRQARQWSPPPGFVRRVFDASYFRRMGNDLFTRMEEPLAGPTGIDLRSGLGVSLGILDRLMSDGTEVGLIHADVHDGNVVFEAGNDRPGLIDFTRSGVGCWALDVAMAQHYLTGELAVPLLDGYGGTSDLSATARRALPALRFLAGIENLTILSALPAERAFVLAELPSLAEQARSLTT